MILTFLADVLRSTGFPVVEEGAWQARGSNTFYAPRGLLWHHTAGGASVHSSRDVVINGRSGLAGPLCNVYICREPAFHIVSGRKANHAGTGGERYAWIPNNQGNNYLIGFECEHIGYPSESWARLYPIMTAGAAALHEYLGLDVARSIDHKEYTTRKPDRVTISPSQFRADVAEKMGGGDDDMPLTDAEIDKIADRVWAKVFQAGTPNEGSAGTILGYRLNPGTDGIESSVQKAVWNFVVDDPYFTDPANVAKAIDLLRWARADSRTAVDQTRPQDT